MTDLNDEVNKVAYDFFSDFIPKYKDLIDRQEWDEVYAILTNEVVWKGLIHIFTNMLKNNCGIDPLDSLYYIPAYYCYDYTELTDFAVSDHIIKIMDQAFCNCTNLKNIKLGEDVTELHPRCFYNCEKLSNIEFNNSLRVIEHSAFAKCNNLVNIDLPASVEFIGDWAFEDCQKLETVTINNRCIKFGGSYIFKNCSNLKLIRIKRDESIDEDDIRDFLDLPLTVEIRFI